MDWKDKLDEYQNSIIDFAPNLLGAIIALVIGLWIANKLTHLLEKVLKKSGLGPELEGFFSSMISIALKIVAVLIAVNILGFKTSALMGILAGAVFAIGLALQGFLGNFASGITIVFFKPYKVGDWVQISDFFGKVESIQIFNTTLTTPGDKTLIIPNGKVTDDIITNFSKKGHIRLELEVTMPYAESFPKVQETIKGALKGYSKILENPEPIIGIESFDSHNIIVTVRPYVNPDDYWEVTFEIHRRIKEAFHTQEIKVAYSEGVELGSIGN